MQIQINKPKILTSPSSRKQLSSFPKMISCSIKVRVRVWLWLIKRQALIAGLCWEVNSDLTAWRPDALHAHRPQRPRSPARCTNLVLHWRWGFRIIQVRTRFLKIVGCLEDTAHCTKMWKHINACGHPPTHTHISLCIALLPTPTRVGPAQPRWEGESFDGFLFDQSMRDAGEDGGLAYQYCPILQLRWPAGRSKRCPAQQLCENDRKAAGILLCLDMADKIAPSHIRVSETLSLWY